MSDTDIMSLFVNHIVMDRFIWCCFDKYICFDKKYFECQLIPESHGTIKVGAYFQYRS